MAAALAFVPPVVIAVGFALYQGVFSEDDRIKHSIVAGILWERTKNLFEPDHPDMLDRLELLGVRDDDSFFHEDVTAHFLKYWQKHHESLPFREDTETFLKRMKIPDFESIMRCEIRFSFNEGLDIVDRKHYEATYTWARNQPAHLLAFPVYEKTKNDGIVFTQKVLYASLSRGDPRAITNLPRSEAPKAAETVVTESILCLAGPRGNFYQDVAAAHRPVVNFALAFWDEKFNGLRYLKLVDTLGLTYVYDLERDLIAQWPVDGPEHLWMKIQPVVELRSSSSPSTYQMTAPAMVPTTIGNRISGDLKKFSI